MRSETERNYLNTLTTMKKAEALASQAREHFRQAEKAWEIEEIEDRNIEDKPHKENWAARQIQPGEAEEY